MLTTRSRSGRVVRTGLRMTRFSFGMALDVNRGTLRDRIAHRPLHFQQRTLTFGVIFSDNRRLRFKNAEEFTKTILDHWAYNLNREGSVPMELRYKGHSEVFRGYIVGATEGSVRHEYLKEREYAMRLITRQTEGLQVRGSGPFVPTTDDVEEWGVGWYSATDNRAFIRAPGFFDDAFKDEGEKADRKQKGSAQQR